MYLLDVSNTQVYDNTVTNSNIGIKFYNMAGSGVAAYHNEILNNNIGIFVEGVWWCHSLVLHMTIILLAIPYGVQNTAPDGIFNADM